MEAGCCFGASSKCDVDDQAKCLKMSARNGCEWRTGYDADCSADTTTTAEPSAKPTTAEPTAEPTSAPTGCPTNHRHRRAWGEISDGERQLYIDGYRKLSKKGLTQRATQAHLESSEHTVPEFLPWHREFIYQLENNIRALGDEFECFTLPYWDWTDEPTPYDCEVEGAELFVLSSGLGGNGQGSCLYDDAEWGPSGYTPNEQFAEDFPENANFDDCLLRDVDYTHGNQQCTFFSAAEQMDLIDRSVMYGIFRPWLEGIPHALPHACFGGVSFGHMSTIYSPDDPLFYLLHGFVDYQWALWQDCNGYDAVAPGDYDHIMYDDDVDAMLDFHPMVGFEYPLSVASTLDLAAYDVSYSKGKFWTQAHVDDSCADISWFYDDDSALSADAADADAQQLTATQAMSQQMYATLEAQYGGAEQSELVHAWAVGVCNTEHYLQAAVQGVEVCLGGAAIAEPDCDSFPRDADTGDIELSREQFEELLEDLRIPNCVVQQRLAWFDFIEVNHWHSFYELCQGCLDNVCDRSELVLSDDKCLFNRKESAEAVRSGRRPRRGSSSNVNTNAELSALVSARAINADTLGLMGMAGMAVLGLGLALRAMYSGKAEEKRSAAYGSMQ